MQLVTKGLIGPAKAPPAQRAAIYATMDLRLTYYPEDETLDIEARSDACTQERVGGPNRAKADWRIQPWDLGK